MKLLIISDIHGSNYYTDLFLERLKIEKPDKIILLGDLYYHGPRNPLPKDYNPMQVCEKLNSLKDSLICIKGNCDAEVDETISSFEFHNSYTLTISDKKFFFTHGQKYNIDNIPPNIDVLVYGHFHTGFIKEKDDVICVNAGSISLPKNDTKHSYLIIDEKMITLKDLLNGEIIAKKYLKEEEYD